MVASNVMFGMVFPGALLARSCDLVGTGLYNIPWIYHLLSRRLDGWVVLCIMRWK
jgi:hypothetical protein